MIPINLVNSIPEGLKKAGEIVDRIYMKQSCGDCEAILNRLTSEESKRLFQINFGPFNRLGNNEPIIEGIYGFPGQGNYPGVSDKGELSKYLEEHEELRESFEKPFTVVKREGETYTAIPFHQYYGEFLEKLSSVLSTTSTGIKPLDRFLSKRAEEILKDDFSEGDQLWLEIEEGLSAYVGPVEVDDPILGVKMGYGEAVFLINNEWTKKGQRIASLLSEFQKQLPLKELQGIKPMQYPGLFVSDLQYAAGIVRIPPARTYLILPPDLPNKSRKIFFKNIIETEYRTIISRIGKEMINEWQEDPESILYFLIMHDIFHYLGSSQDEEGEQILGKNTGKGFLIEEIKADSSAAFFARKAYTMGIIEKSPSVFWKNYLAYLLYLASKNCKPAVVQLNYLIQERGIKGRVDGKIEITGNFFPAIRKMLQTVLSVEVRENKKSFKDLAHLSSDLESMLKRYNDFDFYLENGIK